MLFFGLLFTAAFVHSFDHLLNIPDGVCDDGESFHSVHHLDWDLIFDETETKPFINHSFTVDSDLLKLSIDLELEYLGYAYADAQTAGYGVTYVLDFHDFDPYNGNIRHPGTCQNREASDFAEPLGFASLFNYSGTPNDVGHIAAMPYSAYPPTDSYWSMSNDDDRECTRIHYHGEFTWYELLECQNFAESVTYNQVRENSAWVNLTGTFYADIVSPLSLNTDTGYYRVYQSLSAPFVIAVRKQVNIISKVGIDLFVMSIIAVYKEDEATDWHMVVLTEAADFLQLAEPTLLAQPSFSEGGVNYATNFVVAQDSLNEGCLASGFLCLQLWDIAMYNVSCPPTNFTGSYNLQYSVGCNPSATYDSAETLCTDYISQFSASGVTLSANLEWIDEVCDTQVFIVEFDAQMTFHADDTFSSALTASDQYDFGDIAYVQVVVEDSADFSLVGVDLGNVWICTTSPDNEPLEINEQSVGTSACLSVSVDAGWPRHLVISGAENDATTTGNVTIYTNPPANTVRFSFAIDESIERVNLYVQAQITLDLTPSNATERRRLLAEEEEVSQMRHFSGAIAVAELDLETNDVDSTDEDDEENPTFWDMFGTLPNWAICVVSMVVTGAMCLCCFFVYGFREKQKKLKSARERLTSVSIHTSNSRNSAASSVTKE